MKQNILGLVHVAFDNSSFSVLDHAVKYIYDVRF